MPTTSGGLRYPASSDAVNVPGDLQNLADDVDTAKAPKASPALTGTPTAPTASADTNTTQVATTAYVIGQAASATPEAVGTAAVGTSTRFARADHVHGPQTALSVNAQSVGYTLASTDAGGLVEMGSGSALTLTVPADATTNFAVGTKIDVLRTGAGEVSIAGATSPNAVTVNSEGSKLRINDRWQAVTLIKRAANTWVLIGALKT